MVECVAVTVAQIRQYHLLTRPPKPLDSRTAWYEDMFPDLGCVELHAIAPEDLVAIVRGAIERVITDRAAWALPPPLHHPYSRIGCATTHIALTVPVPSQYNPVLPWEDPYATRTVSRPDRTGTGSPSCGPGRPGSSRAGVPADP